MFCLLGLIAIMIFVMCISSLRGDLAEAVKFMVNYIGVTPQRGGFQAQVTGKYLGWFPNKLKAAKKVARKKRVSLRELIKAPEARKATPRKDGLAVRPLRTHKWIYWLPKIQMWQVKLPNRPSFSVPNKPKALQAVCKILKVAPASFKLGMPHAQDHGRAAASYHLRRIFRIVHGGYKKGPKQAGYPFSCMPADCNYTYKYGLRGRRAKPMEDSGTVLHYIMAKDGPGKEAVLKGFEKFPASKKDNQDLEKLDYDRTSFSCREYSKQYDPKEAILWNKGPGKGTSHTMGLPMWALKSLKLLKKGGGQGSFPLGKTRGMFKIRPLTAALRAKFRMSRAYGEVLLKQGQVKLVHLKDILKIKQALARAAKRLKGVPGLTGGSARYLFRWSTRSYTDYLAKKRGKWRGLKYNSRTKVQSLASCFPDQGAYLAKICGGTNAAGGLCNHTLLSVCRNLDYEDPAEHLTMHMCLSLTPKIRQMMHALLAKFKANGSITLRQEAMLIKKLEEVRKAETKVSKLGILVPPHPAVAVAKALPQLLKILKNV